MQCVPHFHYIDKIFSSIQLLVNKKFFHQSSFMLVKTCFIRPASIYATLFIKVGRGESGGKSETRFLQYFFILIFDNRQNATVPYRIPEVANSRCIFNS